MGLFGIGKAEREREQRLADERARLAAHKLRMEQEDHSKLDEVMGVFARVEKRKPTWKDVSKERGHTTVVFEATEGVHGSIGYKDDHYIYLEINQRADDGQDARIYYQAFKSFYEFKPDIGRYSTETSKAYSYLRDIIKATKESLEREEAEKNRELYEQIKRQQEALKSRADLARKQFFDS